VRALLREKPDLKRGFIAMWSDEKIYGYGIIAMIVASHLLYLSHMDAFTAALITDVFFTKSVLLEDVQPLLMPYRDPKLLGVSAIGWQCLYFVLCGLTFFGKGLYFKKRWQEKPRLLLISVPVLLLSLSFICADYPMRAFDYAAPFFFAFLCVPKKIMRPFVVFSLAFVMITTIQLVQDKKIFFEISDGEIEASQWVSETECGRVFADQPFINQLIERQFYDLTGTHDRDPLIFGLFYTDRKDVFQNAVKEIKKSERVRCFVITNRMRQKYILMLDKVQMPLTTEHFFKELFPILYDNGDVTIYEIE
jgi:hypothetical protein